MTNITPVVLVTGVGPGTGSAIARRFSLGGYQAATVKHSGRRPFTSFSAAENGRLRTADELVRSAEDQRDEASSSRVSVEARTTRSKATVKHPCLSFPRGLVCLAREESRNAAAKTREISEFILSALRA